MPERDPDELLESFGRLTANLSRPAIQARNSGAAHRLVGAAAAVLVIAVIGGLALAYGPLAVPPAARPTSVAAEPSQSPVQPTVGASPTVAASPSAETPDPTATPSGTPTSAHAAALTITGSGGCTGINFGACWPVLLLEQGPVRGLFDWEPSYEHDVKFESDIGYPETIVTGPPPDAPAELAVGSWAVAMASGQGSDVVGTPDSGGIWCVRGFDVLPTTEHVQIDAAFVEGCGLEITFDPPSVIEVKTLDVPVWMPPKDGVMDDCLDRSALLRIDADGRPWWEEIATGKRIEIAGSEEWPDGVKAVLDEHPRVDGPGLFMDLHEWDVASLKCVFRSRDVEWVGGPDYAWEPWRFALGPDLIDLAHDVVHAGRNHEGGPPPAALTVTPANVPAPSGEQLRAFDSEFRALGGDRWSESLPEFWLGNEVGGPAGLVEVLNLHSSIHYADDTAWYMRCCQAVEESGPGEGLARHVTSYQTPRGNTVFAVDEALTTWDDCSQLVFPEIIPSEIEPGFEAGIDPEGEVVTIRVYDGDGDGETLVVASYADPACLVHPVLGPIIDHVLAD